MASSPSTGGLRPILADLHIHTVLSPCAEVEMVPPLIIRRAQELGLGLVGITDHNSSLNCEAVAQAARGTGVHVLPGMELQTREEVHLLCLFDSLAPCLEWQGEVEQRLPSAANDERAFGAQFVVDATGNWIRTEERLLVSSADLTVEQAVEGVHALGGLVIPAHVNRPSYSLLANLGFVPLGLRVEGLEVTPRFVPSEELRHWPQLSAWPLLVSSDAHRLSDMQPRTRFLTDGVSAPEIGLALRGERGRSITVEWPRSRDRC